MSKQPLPWAVRRWLTDALPLWQQQGLLGSAQASGIMDLYESEAEVQDRRGKRVSFALYGLSACLFGLAALLLIGFNWEAMPREVKLATVLTVIATTYGLAFWAKRWSPMLGEIGFFLGSLFYGAGIWLVGQAFHLDAHYPDGLFWWAVGVLPLALLLDSLLIHFLFVTLMAWWAGLEMQWFSHLRPWWAWNLLPNGAWALPVLAAPGLVWAYRRSSPTAVGLYVALFAWWVILQSTVWQFGRSSLSLFWVGGVGALLMLTAERHRPGDRMGTPYRFWGAVLAAGSLIPLSSWRYWSYIHDRRFWNMPSAEELTQVLVPGIGFGLLTVAGVALCYRTPSHRGLVPAVGLASMVGLAFCHLLLPETQIAAGAALVLTNLAMIVLAIYLISVGAREERLRPFGAGILYFLVWAIARYTDLFSVFGGMLGTAGIFVLCGIAIVVIGRFWTQLKLREPQVSSGMTSSPAIPAWAATMLDWVHARTRTILYTAVGFQLMFLVGMIAIESAPLMFGKTIRLRVRPVDPRDFFRGDYVILNYEINNMTLANRPDSMGAPVYVRIEPDPDGEHWRGVSASYNRPTTGDYLVGRHAPSRWGSNNLSFGIEAYYVQEGQGLAWEEAARRGNLTAEIAVAPWGKAKLRRLIIDP
jgi:uncharacterized membrane-anchored protein/uncharacterized membrane protein